MRSPLIQIMVQHHQINCWHRKQCVDLENALLEDSANSISLPSVLMILQFDFIKSIIEPYHQLL